MSPEVQCSLRASTPNMHQFGFFEPHRMVAEREGLTVADMPLEGQGYRIIGVSVFGGRSRSPLGAGLHLALDAPVTALYGLNGAGKSYLLRGVASALSGIAITDVDGVRADVHLTLSDHMEGEGGDAQSESVPRGLASAVGREMMRQLREREDCWVQDAPSIQRSLGDVSALPARLKAMMTPAFMDQGHEWLAEPTAQSATFTLRASGSAKDPAWRICASLRPSESQRWLKLLAEAAALDENMVAALGGLDLESAEYEDLFYEMYPGWDLDAVSQEYANAAWAGGRLRLPPWLPVPCWAVGSLHTPVTHIIGNPLKDRDADAETLEALVRDARRMQGDVFPIDRSVDWAGDKAVPAEELRSAAQVAADQANNMFKTLLLGAPRLSYALQGPTEWLLGERPLWAADDPARPAMPVPLHAVSPATRRWAELAIGIGTAESASLPVVFICDEPEAGLHRRAEAHLPVGLVGVTARAHCAAIVATHSTAMLDQQRVLPVHVHRDMSGRTRVVPLSVSLLDELDREAQQDQLGLRPGDLLDLMRVAVIVEGLHDELAVKALLRDTLIESGAAVLPARGAKGLRSLAEANLLFTGTDAPLLLVVDNVGASLSECWEAARARAGAGETERAIEELEPLQKARTGEARWLYELGRLAIRRHRLDRVRVFGLSLPDIICYLPPEQLLRAGRTWEEALDEWARQENPSDLKQWLLDQGWANTFSSHQIEVAVRAASKHLRSGRALVHPDLVRLSLAVRALGAGGQNGATEPPDRVDDASSVHPPF